MKKLFVVILCLCAQLAFSQVNIKYNNQELATLSKVWGLMKYYHPAVSQGKIDWDYVLLKSLNGGDKQTVGSTVQSWINLADKTASDSIVKQTLNCDSLSLKNFDVSWINGSELLPASQKARLNAMVANPGNIGTYWSQQPEAIRYTTDNEKTYKENTADYRLLNLFRIWNVIEYYYPYKYLLTHKWANVLTAYVPQFSAANDSLNYKKVLTRFAAELNDTHVNIDPTYNYDLFGAYGAPFNIQNVDGVIIITKLVKPDICKAAGIETGDLVSEVDGRSIAAIINENKQYIPASNPSVVNREVYNYLFSGKDSTMKITGFKKDGKPFKTVVKRIARIFNNDWDRDGIPAYTFNYHGKNYRLSYFDAKKQETIAEFTIDNIGYIEFSLFKPTKIDSLMKAMKNTKGIVFDLRGYNSEGYLLKTFYYLYPKPTQFGIKSMPVFSSPGKFCYDNNILGDRFKYVAKDNIDYYKGQVVVLINEYTQSAEEMWAMLFKYVPHVIFVGSQTAGADGNETNIKLTDGRQLVFSGLGIYYPGGKETQRIGIAPDVLIRPTIQSIRSNQDILVEKAFNIINKN